MSWFPVTFTTCECMGDGVELLACLTQQGAHATHPGPNWQARAVPAWLKGTQCQECQAGTPYTAKVAQVPLSSLVQ